MLKIDLHLHTNKSMCGLYSLDEIVRQAKSRKMKIIAITDHGDGLYNYSLHHYFSVFTRRLPNVLHGVRVLKGIESTVLDDKGNIDVPLDFKKNFDLILCGVHRKGDMKDLGKKKNTARMITAIEKNNCIDIITHPNQYFFPTEIEPILDAARSKGAAVEINNSSMATGKEEIKSSRKVLEYAIKHENLIVFNSDAHVLDEVGTEQFIQKAKKGLKIPAKQLLNSSEKKVLQFVLDRKKNKC